MTTSLTKAPPALAVPDWCKTSPGTHQNRAGTQKRSEKHTHPIVLINILRMARQLLNAIRAQLHFLFIWSVK
jgi:hypothetical protein